MDAVLGKRRVDSGLDRLQYRLLDQPVYHRRYPELTLPAIRLRYLQPEYGLRFVPALDIPIGLPSDGADRPRPSDLAARDFVGPRRSSVFLAPRRPVFAEETFDSGNTSIANSPARASPASHGASATASSKSSSLSAPRVEAIEIRTHSASMRGAASAPIRRQQSEPRNSVTGTHADAVEWNKSQSRRRSTLRIA